MQVAVFSMNAAEATADVRILIRDLRSIGASCVLVTYWTTDYTPKSALQDLEVPFLTILEGGLHLAPRLTEADYVKAGGAVPDFVDLALHDHGVHGWEPSEQRLRRESAYYQRLRGAAIKARHILRTIRPDLVIVPHGAEPISRAIAIEAQDLGIATLIFESSFFPGFLNLDHPAQHFYRGLTRIDRMWSRYENSEWSAEDEKVASAFVSAMLEQRSSKYPQVTSAADVRKLRELIGQRSGKLAFLPAQLPWDANVLPGLGNYRSLHELYEAALDQLPPDWRVIVKVHPKDSTGHWQRLPSRSNVLVVQDVGIHELMEFCDVVLVHSSNVGVEAAILGKPVVVLGTPYYAGKGLTIDVDVVERLPEAMKIALGWRPDPRRVLRMVAFLIRHHLVPIGNGEALRTVIAEASEAQLRDRTRLCWLGSSYGAAARQFLQQALAYNALAERNYFDSEIRERVPAIGPAPINGDRNRLATGERQTPYDFADVERQHLARYMLADAIMKPGLQILDIACGSGYGAHLLGDRAKLVIGVDPVRESIEFARRYWARSRAQFHVDSAGSWFERHQERAEHSLDAVVAFETIEHLTDDGGFIRYCWAALRPGGCLLLSSPNADNYPLTDNVFHVRHYDRKELSALLSGLPELAELAVWSQNANEISSTARAGRFLVGVARKAGPQSVLSVALADIVPFSIGQPPVRASFTIGGDAFSTGVGTKRDGQIFIDLASTDCHVVYGPYRKLAAGSYVVNFDLALEGVEGPHEPGSGELTLEVVNTADEFMAKQRLPADLLATLAANPPSLAFTNHRQETPIEFRIHASGRPVRGQLIFKGVVIERVSK